MATWARDRFCRNSRGAAGKILPTSARSWPRAGTIAAIHRIATRAGTGPERVGPESVAGRIHRQSLIAPSRVSGRPLWRPAPGTRTARKVLCKHILQNAGKRGNENTRGRYNAGSMPPLHMEPRRPPGARALLLEARAIPFVVWIRNERESCDNVVACLKRLDVHKHQPTSRHFGAVNVGLTQPSIYNRFAQRRSSARA